MRPTPHHHDPIQETIHWRGTDGQSLQSACRPKSTTDTAVFRSVVPMSRTNSSLPGDWSEVSASALQEPIVGEYRLNTAAGTTFVVSIISEDDAAEYKVRFSTMYSASPIVRYDYHVGQYGSQQEAREVAVEFLSHLEQCFKTNDLSRTAPEIESIHRVIRDFHEGQSPFSKFFQKLFP